MRAFIGIALPPEIRASLHGLQQDLAASGADVKWVEPANLHVTLKFLDEITPEQAEAVKMMLGRLAGKAAAFSLGLSCVGAFPSLAVPRVIWVGLEEGKELLARLAASIEEEARARSLRKEERPFSPHMTIGRVRSSRGHQALTQALREAIWTPPPAWTVGALTLYQSVLSPAGPRYTALTEVPLGGTR